MRYQNRRGATYYLPEYGPPVRWISSVSLSSTDPTDLPTVYYFECDAQNLGSRAVQIFKDGRVLLAHPGGLDGDYLPEGKLPPVGGTDQPGIETREITQIEFNAIWAALSRLKPSE
ncbi:DUF6881 domain-containing protein [Mesorhizobium sp. ASY16-5R]|uniref:DUF6881 domain-containing protein n=1 Tax=Mesorhizobium sp. ASY16-5R TaxID=3445772 RepID=UPI003FA0C9CD